MKQIELEIILSDLLKHFGSANSSNICIAYHVKESIAKVSQKEIVV